MCGTCGCNDNGNNHHHHDGRLIKIEQDLLAENKRYAIQNREFFHQRNILAINLVSSPGSGKTSLLVNTIRELKNTIPIRVIEGDQQTERDAERIRQTNVPVIQINTGKACHLDAHRIQHAITELTLPDHSLLFIENVGNLVCPALFDLGEAHKVVLLSVTEGDDKPLKYPDMFVAASLMVINKIDLLPYVEFDIDHCIAYAKRIHPQITTLCACATREQGLKAWLSWLTAQLPQSMPLQEEVYA